MNRQIVLIAHNIRSTHNIGALLRTADGLGVRKVFLTGYTPYPQSDDDERLPYLVTKINKQIHKTALGAESSQKWAHIYNPVWLLLVLKILGFEVAALEQASQSVQLATYEAPPKIALVVGREVEGVEPEILALMDTVLEIPMLGQKESFNVSVAAAMALYHFRFRP